VSRTWYAFFALVGVECNVWLIPVLGTRKHGVVYALLQRTNLLCSFCQERYYLPAFPCKHVNETGRYTDQKDNTRYAFLQLEDRVLVYRGADQPDMSVINPESDVWQHIKVCPPTTTGS